MKIAIASDHAGYRLKELVKPALTDLGLDVELEDLGTYDESSVDYPDYAEKVATGVASGSYERGILICGTGLGMCISANKVPGIRAVTVTDEFSAKMSRAHNDANIITLGERVVGPGLAVELIQIWLETEFEGGRHQRRVDKMIAMDDKRSDA